MKVLLALMFFVTALIYASVGFGGGSTYTALLVLAGTDRLAVPVISLACNISVVSVGAIRYLRAGLVRWARVWPFLILSVPAAWIGGRLPISESVFVGILSAALFFAGLMLLRRGEQDLKVRKADHTVFNALIGGGLGLISGLVGIGGGIFLAPVLHLRGWGRPREIAALSSLFILVNSLAGLTGQLLKLGGEGRLDIALALWGLIPVVVIGGLIGNHLSLRLFPETLIRRMTAVLVLFVAARLAWKFITLSIG